MPCDGEEVSPYAFTLTANRLKPPLSCPRSTPGPGPPGSLNKHLEAPRSSSTPATSRYNSRNRTAPLLLRARLVSCWISKGRGGFDPPGSRRHSGNGRRDGRFDSSSAGPHSRTHRSSALYAALTIDDFLRGDSLTQPYPRNRCPPSSPQSRFGWGAAQTGRRALTPMRHLLPQSASRLPVPPSQGKREKINQFLLYTAPLFADPFGWSWEFISFPIP